jgi:hypothetical protein
VLELLKCIDNLKEISLSEEEFVVFLACLLYRVKGELLDLPMMVSTGNKRASSLKYSLKLEFWYCCTL